MRIEPFRTSPASGAPRTGVHAATGATPPAKMLDVTIDGATQRFEAGTYRSALAGTIASLDMLPASITQDGRLQFVTNDARELVVLAIAEGEAALDVLEGLLASIEIVE